MAEGLYFMGFYNSFVVRIWSSEVGKPDRGYIQHVGTQHQRHFLEIHDVLDFILSHLTPPTEYSPDEKQASAKEKPADLYGENFRNEPGT